MKKVLAIVLAAVLCMGCCIALTSCAAEEETTNTLPEAGNPLAMALLALLAIGIGGIKRRF